MKKGIYTATLFTAFLLGNTGAQAQAGLKKANKEHNQWAYIDAINIYEKVAQRGYVSKDLLEKLGDAYYFNARYGEAEKHYERLFTEYASEAPASEYYYRYAQTLQHTGKEDEATMYFSSDRPGGFGGSDLWQVAIHPSGAFGGPVNMGSAINTEMRDTFPFVTETGELYFSSDGRIGLGGLDVYATKLDRNSNPGEIHNVGAPVNSNADDFAYYIDRNTKNGFFSSNREGGKGNDDIYSFYESKPLQLECIQKLLLTVVDSKTRDIITDANVTLYDRLYNELETSNRYQNDGYVFNNEFKCGEGYRLKVEKNEYTTKEDFVQMNKESGVTEHTIVLERKKTEVKKGDDLFKVLKLNPIYFDLDKYNIRTDAAAELAKVLAVLEEYPTMKIDIRSHTDSRASHKYNDKLSEGRAKSTREWLIDQGIDASRLTAKGYGERQLINQCADGVKCSEEAHQANRRSEFIIMEM